MTETKIARKKKPEWDDPGRSALFMETAERIQADDAEERFKEAMKRIAKAKRLQTKSKKQLNGL